MDLLSDVETFNRAADVLLLNEPGWPPHPDIDLALALIDEEAGELCDALNARDMIEVADGIADLLYVTAGLILRIGGRALVDLPNLVNITHRAPGWDVYDSEFTDYPEKIESAVANLKYAVERREHHLTCNYAEILVLSVAALGSILALPMEAVWRSVQASNLSKIVGGKVLRNDANKIVKPPTYMPPDIPKVLALYGWRAA
ncbi:nucleoside triphosphate pyrophosphohydrolase family protein [Nocardia flavorosea]|uniref:Nucleoside triphosphate pyrophosphohydrolase family protein n=1 Tax=Nocardia flavorosea TaxID=53429 RepID=A0A846YMV7_9NOCA|nr:nucleoside triphosphate pyrophosphohydrolase family protein [Nocardia flavorosea]NKY60375.1 nucleoside triphosphate pyrophosphohydrolase family protein [Nocardia flavorosea]